MPVWDAGPQALATRSPAVSARHLRGGSGLVDEHQSARVEVELTLEPGRAPHYDVGSGLFVRVRRLFLSVILWRSKKRHSVPMPAETPCSAKRVLISAKVMSSLASTSPGTVRNFVFGPGIVGK